MGFTQSLYDWLGNRLSGPETLIDGLYTDAAKVAMTDAAFRIAVNYVSSAIGKSEFKTYTNGKADTRSWESYLWTLSPNLNINGSAFINDLVWKLYSRNRAVVIPWGNGLQLVDDAVPDRHPFAEDIYHDLYVRGERCPQLVWKASDLYVFELGNPDVASMTSMLGEQYGALLQAAANQYKSHSGKYKLTYTSRQAGMTEDKTKHDEYVNDQLKPFLQADSAVLPEHEGMKLEPFNQEVVAGLSSDFINLRKDCFEAVAFAMKMPTSMLYGNVNNFKEVFKSFITFAVAPVAEMMSDEITRKYYRYNNGWKDGSELRIDISNIKYNDLFDAAASADKLIASSLLSPDGVMRYLGLDPVGEAWSQKHYMTKNYSPAGETVGEGGDMNG